MTLISLKKEYSMYFKLAFRNITKYPFCTLNPYLYLFILVLYGHISKGKRKAAGKG